MNLLLISVLTWAAGSLIQLLYLYGYRDYTRKEYPEYNFYLSRKKYAAETHEIPLYNTFGMILFFMQFWGYGLHNPRTNDISLNLSAIYRSYNKHNSQLQPESIQDSVQQVIEHEDMHSAISEIDVAEARNLQTNFRKANSSLGILTVVKDRIEALFQGWRDEESVVREIIRKRHSVDLDTRNGEKE